MGVPHTPEHRREPQGLSRLWIRSALAPPSWSSRWALGAAGVAVVAAVEALVRPNPALGSALAAVAVVVGLTRGRGEAVLDLLVPAYADVSMLDLAIPGYERRIGVRVAGPRRDQAEEWLRRRPPIQPHLPGAQRAIATGVPTLVEELDDELLREIAADEADLAELRRTRA